MGNTIRIEKNGRHFEIRALVTAGDWQIWVFQGGVRIYLCEIVPFAAEDDVKRIRAALCRAKDDILNDSIAIPVVRQGPGPPA